ncbi:hypothetical protein MUK42_32701 [Musa troglodytarum]|uniref:Uncharacterized protein n=1 Tax=Musa troglodytarum TaxID=320322 RepID=A0A9E7GFE5_9LILI|nr:hypothetical protein MUK42_32701 [Musa troglodytarum]
MAVEDKGCSGCGYRRQGLRLRLRARMRDVQTTNDTPVQIYPTSGVEVVSNGGVVVDEMGESGLADAPRAYYGDDTQVSSMVGQQQLDHFTPVVVSTADDRVIYVGRQRRWELGFCIELPA